MQKKIPLYILLLTLFFGAWITVLYGAFVRHIMEGNDNFPALQAPALKVAEFPMNVKNLINGLMNTPVFLRNRFPELDGFKNSGKIPEGVVADKGYLLVSSFTHQKEPNIELIRINDQKVVYQWNPNFSELLAAALLDSNTSELLALAPGRNRNYVTYGHSILLEDGSVAFALTDSGIYKIGLCSELKWVLNRDINHTLELDSEGNYWGPAFLSSPSDSGLGVNFIDNAITNISQSGEILFVKPVVDILMENGYQGLLLVGLGADPIHLNDIQPALTTTEYWQKDDLLLSLRDLNTVLLYRPSTEKVIWLKTGPWIGQHDVNFVDESAITVFSNNVFDVPRLIRNTGLVRRDNNRIMLNGRNSIYRFDFKNDSVTTPYANILKSKGVRTFTGGRAEVLENGDVFIEESNSGRLLRLTPENSRWEYVRRVNEDYLSTLSWTRYLTAEQVQLTLPKMKSATCNN